MLNILLIINAILLAIIIYELHSIQRIFMLATKYSPWKRTHPLTPTQHPMQTGQVQVADFSNPNQPKHTGWLDPDHPMLIKYLDAGFKIIVQDKVIG